MPMSLDPATVRPTPGKLLVQIVEILGGMTPGGIFVPGETQDHAGKDTFFGKVIRRGTAPTVRVDRDPLGAASVTDSSPWPEEYRTRIAEGDVVVFPRDVPLAFFFGEDRFALVLEHEAILSIPAAEYREGGFEVVPWRPPALPESFGGGSAS